MSEEITRYIVGPDSQEQELCDQFMKLWKRKGCDLSVVINSILETVGTEAACGPYRKLYRKTLEWEKRLFNKDPEAYRRKVEQRLDAMLAGRR